jgi:hypothetical protein
MPVTKYNQAIFKTITAVCRTGVHNKPEAVTSAAAA